MDASSEDEEVDSEEEEELDSAGLRGVDSEEEEEEERLAKRDAAELEVVCRMQTCAGALAKVLGLDTVLLLPPSEGRAEGPVAPPRAWLAVELLCAAKAGGGRGGASGDNSGGTAEGGVAHHLARRVGGSEAGAGLAKAAATQLVGGAVRAAFRLAMYGALEEAMPGVELRALKSLLGALREAAAGGGGAGAHSTLEEVFDEHMATWVPGEEEDKEEGEEEDDDDDDKGDDEAAVHLYLLQHLLPEVAPALRAVRAGGGGSSTTVGSTLGADIDAEDAFADFTCQWLEASLALKPAVVEAAQSGEGKRAALSTLRTAIACFPVDHARMGRVRSALEGVKDLSLREGEGLRRLLRVQAGALAAEQRAAALTRRMAQGAQAGAQEGVQEGKEAEARMAEARVAVRHLEMAAAVYCMAELTEDDWRQIIQGMTSALKAAVPAAEEAAEMFASLVEAAETATDLGEAEPAALDLCQVAREELVNAAVPGGQPEALAAAHTLALLCHLPMNGCKPAVGAGWTRDSRR
jgi:hypothetical protein